MKRLSMLGIIGGAALLTAAPFSLQWSQKNVPLSLDRAEADATRIAGVSRRVHRRAYRCAVYGTSVFCDLPRNPFNVGVDDTAPHISLHLPVPATTYHLSISRYLTATVSRVRSTLARKRRCRGMSLLRASALPAGTTTAATRRRVAAMNAIRAGSRHSPPQTASRFCFAPRPLICSSLHGGCVSRERSQPYSLGLVTKFAESHCRLIVVPPRGNW